MVVSGVLPPSLIQATRTICELAYHLLATATPRSLEVPSVAGIVSNGRMRWVVVLALLSVSTAAHADGEKRIVVFAESGQGSAIDEPIAAAAKERLEAAGWIVTVSAEAPTPGAGPFLLLKVETANGVFVRGELVGEKTTRSGRHCECEPTDVAALSTETTALVDALLEEHAEATSDSTLEIVCETPGVSLELDRNVGLLECGTHAIRSGPYTIVASKAGYQTERLLVQVPRGAKRTVTIELTKIEKSKAKLYVALGLGGFGVGALTVGAANFFTRKDGVAGNDRRSEENARGTFGLVVGGIGVASIAGAAVFYMLYRRTPEPVLVPGAVAGSPGVIWAGSF